jgi:tetratricopeptide (TPR) repeat protein
MKFLFALFLLVFFYSSVSKSQLIFDSIGISDYNVTDRNEKISAVFAYCDNNLLSDAETVKRSLDSLNPLLIDQNGLNRWAEYAYRLANYYYLIESFDSSLVYYKKAVLEYNEHQNDIAIRSLGRLTTIAANNGNFNDAKTYLEELSSIVAESSNPIWMGIMHQHNAYINMLEEFYPQASDFYQKAISNYREAGDTVMVGGVYSELALMYSRIGNYPLAVDYLTKSERLFEKLQQPRYLADVNLQKGFVFITSAKYNEALYCLFSAEKLYNVLNDQHKLIKVYNQIGKAYEKLLIFDTSFFYLQKAFEKTKLFENEVEKSEVASNLGDLYTNMGQIAKAQQYYQKSLLHTENTLLKLQLYEKLSTNYSVLGEFEKAYKYQIMYNSLNQSLLTGKNEALIDGLEEQFIAEIQSTENEKQLLQKELTFLVNSKKQSNTFLWLAVGLQLLAILVLVYFFSKRQNRNKLVLNSLRNTIRLQRNKLGKAKLDYDKLKKTSERIFSITTKNMWEPFWVLERLSNQLISNAEFEKFSPQKMNSDNDQLIMARNLLENVLHWAKNQQGLLEFHPDMYKINDLLEPIIKTQALRALAKNIEIKYTPQFNLTVFTDRVTSEVAIRNVIENAVKFSTLNGMVTINAISSNNFVEIIITDSGVGMTRDQISALFSSRKPYMASGTHGEKGVGLGLSLTKEFIERNFGVLKIESSIAFGTTVRILLPSKAKNG